MHCSKNKSAQKSINRNNQDPRTQTTRKKEGSKQTGLFFYFCVFWRRRNSRPRLSIGWILFCLLSSLCFIVVWGIIDLHGVTRKQNLWTGGKQQLNVEGVLLNGVPSVFSFLHNQPFRLVIFFLFVPSVCISDVNFFLSTAIELPRRESLSSIAIQCPLSHYCNLYMVNVLSTFCVKYTLLGMRKILFSPFFFRMHIHSSSIHTQPRWGMKKYVCAQQLFFSSSPPYPFSWKDLMSRFSPVPSTDDYIHSLSYSSCCILSWSSLVLA